ncbi:MAG TPA: cellulose binding domain-containing protein, partial [Polyangiaceae bacterium]|nr:cellulose binding domain-containing protein [Polyangiaceae bacterium]
HNQALDPGETDVDCGGSVCGPCATDRACLGPIDCASGSCTNLRCGSASCTDSVLNQDETAVDCGGLTCPACTAGQSCDSGRDCQSQVCMQTSCASASCADFTQNGSETGVDCGGGCPGCATGLGCSVATDCSSSVCSSGVCQAPRCDDQIKNGSESDIDCGTGCTLCAIGRTCLAGGDCTSGVCTAGQCAPYLHAEFAANDPEMSTATPHPFLRIVNDGTAAVPLHELTLRYYYSKEPAGSEAFSCYWVSIGDCPTLAPATFHDLSPKTATADRYLEISFVASAPSLTAKQNIEIHDAFFIPNYPFFTQTNDYSFSTNTDFVTSQHVTVYRNGALVWGTEP